MFDRRNETPTAGIANAAIAAPKPSTRGELDGLTFETALGTCGVRWSDLGIAEVVMPGSPALRDVCGIRMPGATPSRRALTTDASAVMDVIAEAVAGIVALLAGERRDLRSVALDERAVDPFRRAVYAATREIAPGSTASYGEIARAIGEPGSAREVGAALGVNPFPIVVPCHRVLAADGALHGFSAPGGIATKRRMLEIECAPGFVQQTLFA
ncbi:MAG TPA: MGMT family protein [Solirubrobacteraceae bacterium]|jgi:methylated-DNA-[protein]-cysteine S-methyltransferase|nr:MGMT family protein [Solirubrobacteraceae bacterium]